MSLYEVRQLPAPAGSATEPSVAFLGDSNTGIYSPGADQLAISTGGAERMRVTSAGQVRLAGAGITFNGDTAAANELDDYEEGTWTPVVTGWTSTTYANQVGSYVKIGRQVTAWFYLGFTGTSAASAVTITGLPFTVATRFNGGAITYHDAPTDETGGINIFPTGTTINFYGDNDTSAVTQSNANITTSKFLVGSVTYAV